MGQRLSIPTLLGRGIQFLRAGARYPSVPGLILSRLVGRGLDRLGVYNHPKVPRQKDIILRRDWGVLIILDACRLDAYLEAENKPLDGIVGAAYSGASVTPHWLMRTWLDGDWSDTIYISANIFANKSIGRMKHLHRYFDYNLGDVFMDIVEVWRTSMDRETGIIHPRHVYRAFRMVRTRMRLRKYVLGKDYRVVLHFMQPHLPYITMENLSRLINKLDKRLRDSGLALGYDYLFIPLLRKYSSRERQLIWRHYMSNLEEALNYVRQIVMETKGVKKIITADHGEMLGEQNMYFHFDIDHPILRVVPLHILE